MKIIDKLDGQETTIYVMAKALTDGSIVYDMHIKQDDNEIIITCLSKSDAQRKASAIVNYL